jgi:E3 ubiquitin-protein ligase MUL1
MYAILTGIRQRGVQVTEEMLREGKFITGIGELTSENKEHGLKLQPPSDGSPFYLTVLPVSSLIRRLDNQMRMYKYVQSTSLANFLIVFIFSSLPFLYTKLVMFPQIIT